MDPITKPNVSLTLRTLESGDHVVFNLSEVSEPNVRSICSRLSRDGRQFDIERVFPHLRITRLS